MQRIHAERWILPIIALLILAADQVTKSLVVTRLEVGQSMDLASWLAPIFHITYVTNTGVAFGMFQGMGDVLRIVTLLMIVLLFLYHRQIPLGQVPVRIALGFQMGGALGNFVDRVVRGSVVDFIDLNFWPLETWPVFNLADASLVTGVVLLAILMIWEQQQETQREGEAA